MTNEDAYGVALLRSLAADPIGPSGIDPSRAIKDGRRRRRNRRAAGVAAVGMLAVVAVLTGPSAFARIQGIGPRPQLPQPASRQSAAPASAVQACEVQVLPYEKNRKALITAGDHTGHYFVGRGYDSSPYPMLVWRDGVIVAKPKLPGEDGSFAAVNARGDAVGSAYTGAGERPYAYHDGAVVELRSPITGAAVALNDAGTIVGNLDSHPSNSATTRPVRWSGVSAQPVNLPLPAGTKTAAAVDIDEDGTVLGTVTDANNTERGYVWFPDGTTRQLAVPNVRGGAGGFFWPKAIRNGWITGRAGRDETAPNSARGSSGRLGVDRVFTGYRYQLATGRFEELPGEVVMVADVSADGWVVGEGAGGLHLWTGATPAVPLPLPRGTTGDDTFPVLSSISDDGRTVGGYWSDPKSDNQALMWRCR